MLTPSREKKQNLKFFTVGMKRLFEKKIKRERNRAEFLSLFLLK